MSVISEVKVFIIKVIFYVIGEHTMVRNHIKVSFVIKLVFLELNLHLIRKHTLGRSHLNVRSVIKVLFKKLFLYVIREHTMVKSYVNVTRDRSFSLKSSLVCHQLMEETMFHWYSD